MHSSTEDTYSRFKQYEVRISSMDSTNRLFQVTKHLGSTVGTVMLDIMEEWVGTGCGDCCRVGRSTLAKYDKIEADVSAIDLSVKERELVLGTPER